MDIVIKRVFGVTELIVNGMVYAEEKGVIEKTNYTLEVNVENVGVKAVMAADTSWENTQLPTMFLYVDGNLLAKKTRIF